MNALARAEPPSLPWQNPAPWYLRAIDTASTYLPLLLMALLALGTWWLVKNTPLFEGDRAAAPPRHEPDYTMTQFMVQRFGAARECCDLLLMGAGCYAAALGAHLVTLDGGR